MPNIQTLLIRLVDHSRESFQSTIKQLCVALILPGKVHKLDAHISDQKIEHIHTETRSVEQLLAVKQAILKGWPGERTLRDT
ncbi:hypothetical protein MAR_035512 [Mya arenaria]|uniref:Uncharacterized protein n=1 Tax=Mya arenaria TaxID=6604 RepID=A0ABY7ETC9_MYAAR|nr:hypothetical protein MAR_035512 [Mya arenaria]